MITGAADGGHARSTIGGRAYRAATEKVMPVSDVRVDGVGVSAQLPVGSTNDVHQLGYLLALIGLVAAGYRVFNTM